ncbi:hypothetical protein OROGR_001013 [Orobanche gracilis]
MGCAGSRGKADETPKNICKPKPWKHTEQITGKQLIKLRDEFWDTAPHYGGCKEIWDALKAAAETTDMALAKAIVDSAGAKYELPNYVLSEPTNLIRDSGKKRET